MDRVIYTIRLIFIIAMAQLSFDALAMITSDDIETYTLKAKNFLCERQFCIQKEVPVIIKKDMPYLSYFDAQAQEIWVREDLTTIQLQVFLIHELTHLFRCQFNSAEKRWLNEGLAKWMEYQYSGVWPVDYENTLSDKVFFLSNREEDFQYNGKGYPFAFWFFVFLYNHFGKEKFLQKVLTSPLSGWDNIITNIHQLKQDQQALLPPDEFLTRESILRHFAVALWENDPYIADYGLFQIDPKFSSLKNLSKNKVFTKSVSRKNIFSQIDKSEKDAIIYYTPFYLGSRDGVSTLDLSSDFSFESYVISHEPTFRIQKTQSVDTPVNSDVFISVVY